VRVANSDSLRQVTPADEPLAPPDDGRGAPALTPRAREIASVARELLETEGPEAVSMRRIADRLGIRAPSLYKHVPDKAALEAALIAAGFEELAERFGAAGTPRDLRAVARAYREWALEHPHLYRLMTRGRLPRERLPAGVEAAAAAPVIAATGGDPDAARAAFAFAHGMVILELDDRFPEGADLDAAWERGIAGLSPRN
jgi:AcrR family transcriptional regulator